MGGGKILSEASYIYERSELRVKRVTSEASINQLGVGAVLRGRGFGGPPQEMLENEML